MDASFTDNDDKNRRYQGLNPSFAREVWAKRRRENADWLLQEKKRKREKRMAEADKVIANLIGSPLDCASFIKAKCVEHGITHPNLIGRGLSRELTDVRQMIIVEFCAAFPRLSLPKVGAFFNRDHTTIIHALKKQGVYVAREMAPTHMSNIRRVKHGA